jgi:hypothetical protein
MTPEQGTARIMNMLPGLSLEERRMEILMITRKIAERSFGEGSEWERRSQE